MNTAPQPAAETPPPHVQLVQMAGGYWVSKIVYAAAKLNLADHLAGGPKTADELAGPIGAHGPTLYRLMRTLAGLGVLSQLDGGRFGLTPMGEALKKGAPGSAYETVLTMAGPTFIAAFEQIVYSVKTGKTGFEKAFGMPIFDYFAQHQEEASLFSQSMVGIHGGEPPAIAAAYDFSGFETIVDVGGATGNMLSAVLSAYEGPRGILYDLPHVVTDAPPSLEKSGVADRVSIETGSFFESVPSGGDAYILSHIIHDWNEDQCLTILGNVRRAMKPDGKLLIVEFVLPEDDSPHFGKIADIIMLVVPGGQERTPTEYEELLAKAGFKMTRVVATETPVSIVEAEPA